MFLRFVFVVKYLFALSNGDRGADKTALVSCMLRGEDLFATPQKAIFISLPISDQGIEDFTQTVSKTLLIHGLSRYNKWPLIIANTSQKTIDIPKKFRAATIDNYILYFRRRGELGTSLKILDDSKILNPHAKYLVVSPSLFMDDTKIIEEVFEGLRSFQILNAVLLLAHPEENGTFNLFSSKPFKNNHCSYDVKENVERIDICKDGIYHHNASWYKSKVPRVFQSCQLKVMYVNIPPYVIQVDNYTVLNVAQYMQHGMEVGIITNIFAYMNISLIFIKSDEIGNVFPNHTATGSLKYVLNRQADVAIGGYAQAFDKFQYFDASFPYGFQSLVWVVPHEPIPVAEMTSIGQIVQNVVWYMMILFTILTTSLVVVIARRTEHEKSTYKRPTEALIEVVITLNSVTRKVSPKSHGVRLIFSMVLVFALTFNAAYTTYLTSILAKDDRFKEKYSLIEDIIEHNMSIYIAPNSKEYFQDSSNLEFRLIAKSRVCSVKNFANCLKEVALHKNVSFLVPDDYVKHQVARYISKSNSYLTTILRTKVVSYPLNFIMVKGFWGYHKVNLLLNQAITTGLAQKWMRVPNCSGKKVLGENDSVQQGENTLDLRNIRTALFLLITGYLVSITVFSLEILCFKCRQRRIEGRRSIIFKK